MNRFLATTLSTTCLIAATFSASAQTPVMTKGEVQAIVKEYLISNPDVVVEALEAYRENEAKKEIEETKAAVKKHKDDLFNNPTVPSVGPMDADIVIAEFFDYHCGYCKHMLPVINKLLEEDGNVRVVFHELPILSADSKLAAKASLAVYQLAPKKYFDYHSVVMKMSGKYTKERLTQEAVKFGIDEKKFAAALDSKQLDNALKSTSKLAKKLGVNGTPALFIGEQFIPGASSLEVIKGMIAEQRKAAKDKK